MISELLAASEGWLLAPILIAIAGTALVKALFVFHGSKSQARREFLELWKRREAEDDLWLEVAVRHLFGDYLPATVIRLLQQRAQAGRALREISECWSLLEIDSETSEVRWCAARHANPRRRRWEQKSFLMAYFLLTFLGLFFAWLLLRAEGMATLDSSILWIYVFCAVGSGFWCLFRAETLSLANKAVPRWLGLH